MEIECEFLFYDSCVVTKVAITKPNVEIASFKGKHQPGYRNVDVTEVYFENARVKYFPRNLQKIFPKVKYLKVEYFPRNLQRIFPKLDTLIIRNCGLKEISREDLIGLEKLVCLSLSDNQLTSLPDDLFSNMPNLKYVSLDGNKIEFTSSKLIEPIVGQLRCFNLTRNPSINEYYSQGEGTIHELMAKIDEKCKPPTTQMIAETAQCDSNRCNAEKIFKGFNEHRLLGRFTDFVVVVGSKEFPVHKLVLATQSPILAEMFEVKTNGRTASKLEISDLSAEAIEAFLDYLYERKLPDAQNAVEIFKLAAKYEVEKLKIICEGIIQETLDESNAFEIFKLASGPHKSEELKVAAFGKLQEKFGGELDAYLINDPGELQEIVKAKNVLDDLMNKARTNERRLV